MCETEIQNASTVWPESVRPLRSTMVTETITGTRLSAKPRNIPRWRTARLGVQRVEHRLQQQQVHAAFDQRLAPASRKPRAVGRRSRRAPPDWPRPATPKRCATSGPSSRPRSSGVAGCAAVKRSTARRAICAPAKFRSATRLSRPYSAMEMALELNVLVSMMSAPASRYCAVNFLDDLRLGEIQHVVVLAQILAVVGKLLAAVVGLGPACAPGSSCPWRHRAAGCAARISSSQFGANLFAAIHRFR